MTSKPGIKRAGPASSSLDLSSASAHRFSPLTPESHISAFCIGLSPGFTIHYSAFKSGTPSQSHLDIDTVRRKVHELNAGKPVEDSFLTYSQVNKAESAIWIFYIDNSSSLSAETRSSSRFDELGLNDMMCKFIHTDKCKRFGINHVVIVS